VKDRLTEAFSALAPSQKAMFLARVAHMATIDARNSYVTDMKHPNRDYDHPDAIILRDANNFVHRVAGYTMRVLTKSEMEGQDSSVIEMIFEYFHERQMERYLSQWVGISN
jgi:hypothetical protein